MGRGPGGGAGKEAPSAAEDLGEELEDLPAAAEDLEEDVDDLRYHPADLEEDLEKKLEDPPVHEAGVASRSWRSCELQDSARGPCVSNPTKGCHGHETAAPLEAPKALDGLQDPGREDPCHVP